jgi:hypothetical protein
MARPGGNVCIFNPQSSQGSLKANFDSLHTLDGRRTRPSEAGSIDQSEYMAADNAKPEGIGHHASCNAQEAQKEKDTVMVTNVLGKLYSFQLIFRGVLLRF